ncbi:MAG TPA: hypothetical protein VGB75_06805 [Jatrophihabitans sp.]|jgi:hypothetical protein|uniref:hypothetical protein n=1 Tax=Jatrophihabitans sp. TaxID=1932789 RepID=UPI002F18FB34
MFRHRRNNGLAGIVMLNGVVLMAFGSTLPWGRFEVGGTNKETLPYGGSHEFGFDQTITSDGSLSDFGPTILVISGVVALCALALFATRIRGLGALWRVISLVSLVPVALVVGSLWSVFDDDPGTEMEGTDSALVRAFGLAMRTNAVSSSIEPGLFLITIGCGVAVVGSLIPAFRSKEVIHPEDRQAPKHGDFLAPEGSRSP